MIALVQRVLSAKVVVAGHTVGEIERGLLVYLGVEKGDGDQQAIQLAKRLSGFRIFADQDDKMNLDVQQVAGKILLVSQFTLAADTSRGKRPGFSTAAAPADALRLYQVFTDALTAIGIAVETGQFGADMQVHSINDGPVTFNLSNSPECG